jgi:hypothetical protein
MCAGWEIHYWRVVEALERERASANVARQQKIDIAHQRLRTLAGAIEKACDRVTNPDAYEAVGDDGSTLPPSPERDTDICDAECQQFKAAYFEALRQLWAVRAQCRELEATKIRGEALRAAIELTRQDLTNSRNARDSAERLYTKLRTSENLRRWNNFKEEVDQTEVRITQLEQDLSNFDQEKIKTEIKSCGERIRDSENAKEAAYAEFVGVKSDQKKWSFKYNVAPFTYCIDSQDKGQSGFVEINVYDNNITLNFEMNNPISSSFRFEGEIDGEHFEATGDPVDWNTSILPDPVKILANRRGLRFSIRGIFDRENATFSSLEGSRFCAHPSGEHSLKSIDTTWHAITLSPRRSAKSND